MEEWSTSKGERKAYDPHPEGSYPAVCVDVFTMTKPNPYKGQANKFTGEIDNRETITNVSIGFLTSEPIEIDGVSKPRYTSYWAPMSWHEKSKLRGFVSKWLPKVGAQDSVKPESLLGEIAMISVKHYTKRTGDIGHSVDVAMPLPKSLAAAVPDIPADFVRHKDKPAKDAATEPAKSEPVKATPPPIGEEDESLPF